MASNKNMVTDCLLAKVNFPLYAAEMLTSRFEKLKIHKSSNFLIKEIKF